MSDGDAVSTLLAGAIEPLPAEVDATIAGERRKARFFAARQEVKE